MPCRAPFLLAAAASALLLTCASPRTVVPDVAGDVVLDGGRLHYETLGPRQYDGAARAEAVVLVHGAGVDRRVWDGVLEPLAGPFLAVRYDRRGYGLSPTPRARFSEADDLRALLDALGLASAHLIGSSAGAGIALDFALRHPQRVRSLVLVSPRVEGYRYSGYETERVDGIFQAARTTGDEAGIERWVRSEGMLAEAREGGPADELRRLLRANARVFRFPTDLRAPTRQTWPLLAEVAVPTLVISGRGDTPDLRDLAEMLVERVPGARRAVVEETGHMVHLERPEEVALLAGRFVREVAEAGPAVAPEAP